MQTLTSVLILLIVLARARDRLICDRIAPPEWGGWAVRPGSAVTVLVLRQAVPALLTYRDFMQASIARNHNGLVTITA